MSESGWTKELVAEHKAQFLSEQERVRAASGFAGALSQLATPPGGAPRPWASSATELRPSKPARKPRAHPERDLQQSCEALLQLDGWRIFRMEQNYSERKKKVVGEPGVPDTLAVRYNTGTKPQAKPMDVQLLWCEWKSVTGKLSQHQRLWHVAERARGALTLVAGQDFPATVAGFLGWYRGSELMRKKL